MKCWLTIPAPTDSLKAKLGKKETLEQEVKMLRREDVKQPTIYIGAGTCGLGAGADKTIQAVKKYLTDKKQTAEVIEVGCIGICSDEPLVDVQLPGKSRVSFSKITADVVNEILDAVFSNTLPKENVLGQFKAKGLSAWDNVPDMNDHPFFKIQKRYVLANCGLINPASIEEYIACGGYAGLQSALASQNPDAICDQIIESGLRGRGGGGFPTGKKWKFARATPADQKYLICNADEGDPGAFMDRAIIESDPHRLLEGMAVAAYAIGATKAYIYIRAEYPLAIKRLEQAIEQAKKWNLLGNNILNSGVDLEIIIKKGAGAFVCGEETALIHSIEGKRGMPRPRPPFPAISGLFGKPTNVNNVETFANIPAILAYSPKEFASTGTETSKGTKVFALSGKVLRTGLVEVAMGTTIRDIVFSSGGGIPNNKQYKAVQIGGPSGGCIPSENLDTPIDYENLKTVGAMMGSGGLVVMDEETCMVDLATFFMDFIQRESCGKCAPCREGTKQMLKTLQCIIRPRGLEKDYDALHRFQSIIQLERLGKVVQDTSLCGLGQTAPNPVLSTLRWFRSEYEAHVYDRRCPAGACGQLMQFSIISEKCVGCTLCAKKCPTNAIKGSVKSVHTIEKDLCIGCNSCMEVCKFNAVIKEK